MSNNFFTKTGNPVNNSAGSSSLMRAEFSAIEAGFDKLPVLTANANKLVQVNATATALEVTDTPTLGTPVSGDATNLTNTIAPQTHAATDKAAPVDADEIPLSDSAATFGLKKLTWANLKATAKTYFDTLYLGISATAANASQLLGATWAAPGAIGSTTPAAGSFTTLSATGDLSLTNASNVFLRATPASGAGVYISNDRVGSTFTFRTSVSTAGDHDAAVLSSTGLAVTGALSATGTVGTISTDSSGSTLNFSRNSANYITATGAASNLLFGAGGVNGQLTLDAPGNLGLGVTPSGWVSSVKGFQIGGAGSISDNGAGGHTDFSNNVYFAVDNFTSGGRYITTGYATSYSQTAGQHIWRTAPSGTAGTAITFTQSLAFGKGTTLALEGASTVAGTGISFPATQLASSDANTFDDYREFTYTATATGMTTSPTGTVTCVRSAGMVTMDISSISGTSNATTFTLTGGPTTMRPSSPRSVLVRVKDNGGTSIAALAAIGIDGTITLYKDAEGSVFTASGTKAVYQTSISYPI